MYEMQLSNDNVCFI